MARRKKKTDPLAGFTAIAIAVAFLFAQIGSTPAGKLLLGIVAFVAVAGIGFALYYTFLLERRSSSFQDLVSNQTAPPDADPWPKNEPDQYPTWKDLWTRISQGTQSPEIDRTTWSLELLRTLEWHRLEIVCAAYFRALDFTAELTNFGPDGGVDINVYEAGSTERAMVVQCKAWNAREVEVSEVREFLGAMAHERVKEGVFVTTAKFTERAKRFASTENMHLVDGADLLRKLLDLSPEKSRALLKVATEGDFKTPTCASCGIKMVYRKTNNPFWGCFNYPRCQFKSYAGLK